MYENLAADSIRVGKLPFGTEVRILELNSLFRDAMYHKIQSTELYEPENRTIKMGGTMEDVPSIDTIEYGIHFQPQYPSKNISSTVDNITKRKTKASGLS